MNVRLAVAAALVAMACGPGGAPTDAGSGSFIAFAADFEGFEAWDSSTLSEPGPDPVHTAYPRTVFINAMPPPGATEFPKGTVIVKKMPFNTFAMVKRGGGYNAAGALGWEWFELVEGGAVAIKWRGLGPPIGEVYGKSGQTCNQCHAGAQANDFVLTPALQLGAR